MQRTSYRQGNQNLVPEQAKTNSMGFVLQVPKITGLSVTFDYFKINQNRVIENFGGAAAIARDELLLDLATKAALAAGTAIGQIDLGSGTANYKGDPSVVRLAPTQADRDFFAAYNASRSPGNQRAVVGGIDILRTSYFNKSEQFTNGFDFDVNYRFPKLAAGQFNLGTNWTYLNDFHAYTAAGSARTEYRNGNSANVGGATPIWRGATTLTWRKDRWGAGLGMYYIGRFTDVNATTTKATWDSLGNPGYIMPVFNNGAYSYRFIVKETMTYNLHLSYRLASSNRWLNQTSVRFGVNNLFNLEPPLSADSRGYEPSVHNSLARGRSFSLQLTKKL